jgi:hypothetical protein
MKKATNCAAYDRADQTSAVAARLQAGVVAQVKVHLRLGKAASPQRFDG